MNKKIISFGKTDGLVFEHQGISNHSADYAPMRFPLFRG